MSEREPFQPNGDHDGAVPASPAAPGPLGATSAEAPGSAEVREPACALCGSPRQADGRCSNGHPVCSCGAPPHADRDGFCTSMHPFKGHGGKLSFKHGRYAEQPPAGDDVAQMESASSAQVLRQLAARIRREVARSVGASTHRMSPSEQARALNMLERLETVESRIREIDGAEPSESTGGTAPADWPQRFALLFADRPDEFGSFIELLLTADRGRCGPLRSQVRLTLDHLEPEGKPVWRGKVDTDPDTVIL